MDDVSLGLGEFAESINGPPWILGERGSPLDAPENTVSGLKLALAAKLDGFSYDVRACASGEPVLMTDERLERTTDGTGLLFDCTLPGVSELDAGAWFSKRYVGEPVPLVDEVLQLFGEEQPEAIHFLQLRQAEALPEVLACAAELRRKFPLRIASRSREVCLQVRDAGLNAVLISSEADVDSFRYVRDERLAGFATTIGGWHAEAAGEDWPCERWGLGVDLPEDLVDACRLPLFGFTTRESARALAVRALLQLAPTCERPPLRVPPLLVEPGGIEGVRTKESGEWAGAWNPIVELENPFPFPVRVQLGLRVRRGAFEVEGLPLEFDLEPGEACQIPTRVVGGSWSPGGDPVVIAIMSFEQGAGRPTGQVLLEAPLVRARTIKLDAVSRRLVLLRENPRDVDASLVVRRHGHDLLVSIENAGELEDPHIVVRVGDHTLRGGQGLRVSLPRHLGAEGVAFSCGIEGWIERKGRRIRGLRRWAGGLPQAADSGEPGRILGV